MKKITLTIDPKVIEQIEANRKDIEAALKRFAETEGRKIIDGLYQDYDRLRIEAMHREYNPRRRIRTVPDHPPYMGGGIITTLHAGKKR